MEYTKDNVKYMITGGAGAELLSTNSYYHYMVAGFDSAINPLMVELPSPPTNYIQRYWSAAMLFTQAMIDENPLTAFLLEAVFGLLVILTILKSVQWRRRIYAFYLQVYKKMKILFQKA
jgi:hypothetical protein